MKDPVVAVVLILLVIFGVLYAIREFFWWMTLTKGRRPIAIACFLLEMAVAGGLAYFLIRYF